jgi:cysteine desulfurase
MSGGWDAILTAGIEHDSVLVPARASGASLIELPVDSDGVVRMTDIPEAIARGRDAGSVLLTLQVANNETGVLQDVAEIARMAKAAGMRVHTDAVQAAGRIPLNVVALGVDYLTLSAHKLGGPKGVGALIINGNATLPGLIAGGGQERRRRAGTENVAAIAGFGAAAEAARRDLAAISRVGALRERLETSVHEVSPSAVVIGDTVARLPNTTCIALPGASAETLVIALDLKGIAVSAGAACSSGKVGASHVLAAMGLDSRLARSAIRVSLGWETTASDITAFGDAWSELALNRERAVA